MLVGGLGVLATLVSLSSLIPYIRDTVSGRTRPQRFTWLIWCVLGMVALVSQRADGASWSLGLVAAQAGGTLVVVVFAVPYGEGGRGRGHWFLLCLAATGISGWAIA